jgi:DNA-binding response OmpR family regulator
MQVYYFAQENENKDWPFFNNDAKNRTEKKDDSGLLDDVKILIVDDNESFLEALSDRLRAQKINCVEVKSGSEAIEAVKRETFDLILLDVVMNEMDGLDTYKKLKNLGCSCPIIFMSAYYDKYEKDIQGLNPFAVLRKPLDFDRLLSFIFKKK